MAPSARARTRPAAWAARLARPPPARAGSGRSQEDALSAHEPRLARRPSAAGPVADFLATFAVFAGLVSIVYYPGRLGTGAVFIALFAATLGGRDRYLVPFSVALTTTCWFLGMVVAVALDRPIF